MSYRSFLSAFAIAGLLAIPTVAFGGRNAATPGTRTAAGANQLRPTRTQSTTTPRTPRVRSPQRLGAQPQHTAAVTPSVPGQKWTYVNPSIAKDREINSAYKGMLKDLKDSATPALQIFPRELPAGIAFDTVPTGESDPMHETVKGLKTDSITAVLLLPTSAHFGTDPAALAKNQKLTVWVEHNGIKTTIVDGAPTFDGKSMVTAVRAQIPLKPGINKVFFDPYPGKTAGVAGFPGGRTWIYEVK